MSRDEAKIEAKEFGKITVNKIKKEIIKESKSIDNLILEMGII